MDDALDILECWSVNQYNTYISNQPSKKDQLPKRF
nr:MAG TPA: hypothetical protein [Bacteriophage sp.]